MARPLATSRPPRRGWRWRCRWRRSRRDRGPAGPPGAPLGRPSARGLCASVRRDPGSSAASPARWSRGGDAAHGASWGLRWWSPTSCGAMPPWSVFGDGLVKAAGLGPPPAGDRGACDPDTNNYPMPPNSSQPIAAPLRRGRAAPVVRRAPEVPGRRRRRKAVALGDSTVSLGGGRGASWSVRRWRRAAAGQERGGPGVRPAGPGWAAPAPQAGAQNSVCRGECGTCTRCGSVPVRPVRPARPRAAGTRDEARGRAAAVCRCATPPRSADEWSSD